MPLYEYVCRACRHQSDEYQSIHDDRLTICPACGEPEYRRVISVPHTDMKEFHKPIEMFSVALSTDDEIREVQRRCPDVRISADRDDPMYGVPIAASRKQKKAVLRATGFTERN